MSLVLPGPKQRSAKDASAHWFMSDFLLSHFCRPVATPRAPVPGSSVQPDTSLAPEGECRNPNPTTRMGRSSSWLSWTDQPTQHASTQQSLTNSRQRATAGPFLGSPSCHIGVLLACLLARQSSIPVQKPRAYHTDYTQLLSDWVYRMSFPNGCPLALSLPGSSVLSASLRLLALFAFPDCLDSNFFCWIVSVFSSTWAPLRMTLSRSDHLHTFLDGRDK